MRRATEKIDGKIMGWIAQINIYQFDRMHVAHGIALIGARFYLISSLNAGAAAQ